MISPLSVTSPRWVRVAEFGSKWRLVTLLAERRPAGVSLMGAYGGVEGEDPAAKLGASGAERQENSTGVQLRSVKRLPPIGRGTVAKARPRDPCRTRLLRRNMRS